MDEGMEMPVADVTPVESKAGAVTSEATQAAQPSKPSPAQEIRNIQVLLVSALYPGNVAPQVIAGYQYLEKMAQKIELDAKHEEEFKARQAIK